MTRDDNTSAKLYIHEIVQRSQEGILVGDGRGDVVRRLMTTRDTFSAPAISASLYALKNVCMKKQTECTGLQRRA